jgi:GH24 family phage-related lysozyme (muramidase)
MTNRYLELEKSLTQKPNGKSTIATSSSYGLTYNRANSGYAHATSIPPHVLERTRRFEGAISHLYLDTVGAVTVGVGRMLPSAEAAAKIDFWRNMDEKLASEQEKKDEWTLIFGKEKGKSAGWYKQFTTLHLTDAIIDTLLTEDLTRVQTLLKGSFADFDKFPTTAQEGLLDMMFNLGRSGLMNKFPKFLEAVKKQDWKTAALQCKRNGIQQLRNDEVRKLFEDAVAS